MEKSLKCFVRYEGTAKVEEEIISTISMTNDIVWNKQEQKSHHQNKINVAEKMMLCCKTRSNRNRRVDGIKLEMTNIRERSGNT